MFFAKYRKFLVFILATTLAVSMLYLKEIENYQIYLLPLSIIVALICLKKTEIKLLIFCLVIWIGLEIGLFPVRFFDLGKDNFVISELSFDKNGLELRDFSNYLNKYQATYTILNSNLNLTGEEFLKSRPNTSFLVTGDVNWLKIVFQQDNKFLQEVSKKYANLTFKENFLFYKNQFAIAFIPDSLLIPREPAELSAALISKMSVAVSSDVSEDLESEFLKRKKAAKRARSYYGHWKTGTARSWAFFSEATLEMLQATQDASPELCSGLKKNFAASASLLVSRKKLPEFAAYIYNNAALAELVCGQNYEKAHQMLKKAFTCAQDENIKKILEINLSNVRNFSN